MKEPRKPGSEGPAPGKPGSLVARPGYEVGYAKPPEGSKFRKGVSGNPRGRPKGSKNKLPALHEERMKAIILEEAYRTIKVRDGTRNVTVPIARAVLRSLAVNAVKGQHRSQRLVSALLASVEDLGTALPVDLLDRGVAHLERVLFWQCVDDLGGSLDLAEGQIDPHVLQNVRYLAKERVDILQTAGE